MHEKNFYTYAMLNPNRIPYIFLSEKQCSCKMLSHAIYFEKSYMLRFYEVEKRLMFYIIKQVLNEPPGWTRIPKFWTRWQQKEPCQWQSLCAVHQKKTTQELRD